MSRKILFQTQWGQHQSHGDKEYIENLQRAIIAARLDVYIDKEMQTQGTVLQIKVDHKLVHKGFGYPDEIIGKLRLALMLRPAEDWWDKLCWASQDEIKAEIELRRSAK